MGQSEMSSESVAIRETKAIRYICIYTFVDLTRFSYLCDPSASSGVNKRDGKEEGGKNVKNNESKVSRK